MMSFIAMNRTVNIDLEPGLYDFNPMSATGKTFLVKMIKSINDSRIIAITYNDILLGVDPEKIINAGPELLVFDRFDLYDEKYKILSALKKANCITIVDYKTQRKFCDFDDTCFVTLSERELEVSL